MKRPILHLAITVLLGCSLGCNAQPGLQRHAILDSSGFEQPMTAFTVEVPAGWQTRGGVFWDAANPCQDVVPSVHWQARSPDGSGAFEILPRWSSEMPDPSLGLPMSNCPQAPIANVRGYLEAIARARHPDGQILDYRDRPDLLEKLRAPNFPGVPGSPLQMRSRTEAGELLVAWNENGRAMREAIAANGIVTESLLNMPMTGPSRSVKVSIASAAAMRAPDGQLDFNLFARLCYSVQVDPGWQARMQQHDHAMAAIATRGAVKAGRIRAAANAEIAANSQRAWQEQQAANDRSHASYIDALRGVQNYRDPDTSSGTVELSNQYQNTWRLQDGSYLQTNSSVNPWVDLGVDGHMLDPIQR